MGFTLTPAYDAAARLKSLTSSWSDAQHPANLLTVDPTAGYTPAGALAKMTYGNGLVEQSSYNNRLQPTQLRTYNPTTSTDVLNLNYGFINSAGANNGNVVTFNSTATQIFMRTYTYDELNRLSTMSSPADASGCYGLTWTYDAWGNRLSQTTAGGSCVSPSHALSAINRIIDTGYVHDAAGNMTGDNIHGYTYNAESELIQVDSGSTATYVYDAGGERVRRTASGVTTDYIRDNSGSVVAEIQGSTWTTGYAYSGSHLIAQYNGALGATGTTTLFSHSDHLGSTRALTTITAGISDSMDYLPYGELLSGGSSTTHKFTGKERDAESGLDDFEARYYSSTLGRFTIPDWSAKPTNVPYGDFGDPQSLNLYGYVTNNPMVITDPTGHDGLWVVDKATGQTTLVIPVNFTGSAATPEKVAEIVKRDNSLDTGDSKVNIQVVATDKPVNGVLNTMDLSPGADEKKYGTPGEGVNEVGGNTGHINTDNANSTGAAAHDVLHFSGVKDQYVEGPKDKDGNRTSTPTPGYDDKNIMTARAGTQLKPEQLKEAHDNKTTKQCTTEDGKTVCQ
jgi:RHS repeat-associated protein